MTQALPEEFDRWGPEEAGETGETLAPWKIRHGKYGTIMGTYGTHILQRRYGKPWENYKEHKGPI